MVGDGNAEVGRVRLAKGFQMTADLVVSLRDQAPGGNGERREVAKEDTYDATHQSEPELDGRAVELLTECGELRVRCARQRLRIGE